MGSIPNLVIFFLSLALACLFSSKNTYSFFGLYGTFLVSICQSMTAIFLAVTVVAACLLYCKLFFLAN